LETIKESDETTKKEQGEKDKKGFVAEI